MRYARFHESRHRTRNVDFLATGAVRGLRRDASRSETKCSSFTGLKLTSI
jgi:hypothetical protein